MKLMSCRETEELPWLLQNSEQEWPYAISMSKAQMKCVISYHNYIIVVPTNLSDTSILRQLAATINAKFPERAFAIRVDVSNEEDVSAAVEATVQRFGRLDYAINSAGLVVAGDAVELIKDTPTSDYERTQSVDGKGIFLCMKYQLRQMLKQDVPSYPRASRGVIVNLASRASLEGVVSEE